jgi:hypothetical protein
VTSSNLVSGLIAITGAGGNVGGARWRRLANRPNHIRPLDRSDHWNAATHDASAVIHFLVNALGLGSTTTPPPPR